MYPGRILIAMVFMINMIMIITVIATVEHGYMYVQCIVCMCVHD